MKVSKRQLRRIIKEERQKLHELGIDRTARAMAAEDPDDLTLTKEALRKIVDHLTQITEIFDSPGGNLGADSETQRVMDQIDDALTHFIEFSQYWESSG
jgi:hypothetical protein